MDLVPVWWGGEGKKVSPVANEAVVTSDWYAVN